MRATIARAALALAGALLLAALVATGSEARRPRQLVELSPPGWVLPGAALDFNFASGQLFQAGMGFRTAATALTALRASTGLAMATTGTWSSFGDNVPRVTNQGLLIEESRTNLMLQSDTLSDWGTYETAVTANAATSPDGTSDAAKIATTGTGAYQSAYMGATTANGSTYALSVFAAPGSVAYFTLALTQSGQGVYDCSYTLSGAGTASANGSAPGSPACSIQAFANGWYRAIDVKATNDTGPLGIIGWGNTNPGSGATIYTWDAQLELGTWPTSPILTGSSTATRSADFVTVSNPPVFNGAVSTMYVAGVPQMPNAYATAQTPLQLDIGNNNSRMDIDRGAGSAGIGMGITVNPTTYTSCGPNVTWNQNVNVASDFAVAANDQAAAASGLLCTEESGNTTFTPTRIVVGSNGNGVNQFDGTITRIAVWPTQRLPNAALVQVTP